MLAGCTRTVLGIELNPLCAKFGNTEFLSAEVQHKLMRYLSQAPRNNIAAYLSRAYKAVFAYPNL